MSTRAYEERYHSGYIRVQLAIVLPHSMVQGCGLRCALLGWIVYSATSSWSLVVTTNRAAECYYGALRARRPNELRPKWAQIVP